MNEREVPCPTCGQPAGSSCRTKASRAFAYRASTPYHVARKVAAERYDAERTERQQRTDQINDAGVD